MRQDFIQIIDKLENDPMVAITVFDLSNGVKNVVTNKTKEFLEQNYGSVKEFFNSLFDNVFTKIGIQPKRRNGSKNEGLTYTWINHPNLPYFEVSLNPIQEQAAPQPSATIAPTYQTNQPVNYGLGDPSGLNAIGLHIAAASVPELKMRNQYLEQRVQDLEKLNRQYEREKDRELTDIEKQKLKSESNHKMLETAGPLLAPVIEKLAGMMANGQGAIPQGLGNPENQTEAKTALFQMAQNVSDATIDYLLIVLQGLNNEAFVNELTETLKKYNLIPNGGN